MPTSRLADALAFATRLHDGQVRNGTVIPYISHPLAVTALVLEHGGDEDQAICAALHDAVEDQGGLATAQEIARRYGPAVADLVLACTDAMPEPGGTKPPWRERKTAFIARLPQIPAAAALVITCDKLHNLTALLADLARDGPSTLLRFNSPSELGWYYRALAEGLAPFADRAPVARLRELVAAFEPQVAQLTAAGGGANG